MSRSAVNYKYINKYGASNEATSRHSWSSSSYYVTCVRVNVCALCVVWVALRGISTTRAIA